MPGAPTESQGSRPPETRRGDVVDVLHGVRVPDPYRWLEDSDAPEVRSWIAAQNGCTTEFLTQIAQRGAIRRRMTALWNYERFSTPSQRGGRYFWYRNDGLQDQDVLYVGETPAGEGRVLLDPNTLSEDGTVSLTGAWVSPDGKLMAYGLSDGGSDWRTFHLLDVATGAPAKDHLQWVKFSGASWTHDNAGFFYSRYDAPADPDSLESVNRFQKLYYHRIGTDQSEDELVYERPDQPEWGFAGGVTDDGRYLVITSWQGTDTRSRVFVKDLEKGGEVRPMLTAFDAKYSVVGNDGPVFYVRTDHSAPRGRLVAIPLGRTETAAWREVIAQSEHTLRGVSILRDRVIASYLADAHSVVQVFDLEGTLLHRVPLPGIGTVRGLGGDRQDGETFFRYTTFTTPGTIYRYDVRTGVSTVLRAPTVEMAPEDVEIRQVFYPSADGTRIPMFIAHRKGLPRDGARPTYLYGYGGFNIPITPYYSTVHRVWLEMGGVLAIANLRGGGEYGKEWHDAGRLANKQNGFDDFHAAAQWLVDSGYTRADRLAIGGRSNGGLLVGAAITQRPELYGAALPGVGVLDMLRFHKFTIGWAWTSDYGSPDDPEMFRVLHAYSPLHNVRESAAYPPTLVTTGDHDDRVVPGHSFKFTAALQRAQKGPGPILIRIETRAGHGQGKPTKMRIAEWTDQWAFLVKVLGMELPAGF